MAFWSSFGLSNGMAAAAAAATVAVAGVVGFQFLGEDEARAPDGPQPITAPSGVVTPSEQPDPEIAAGAPPAPEAAPQGDVAAPISPSFDLVRVDAAGGAVIAGRAAANADLRLRLDGQEVLMANSDGTGSFVAMLSIPPSDLPQILSLEMVMAGGDVLISDQNVIIQPASNLAAAAPASDASPDLPDIDVDLPGVASAADPALAGATAEAPQLTVPEGSGAVPATGISIAADGGQDGAAPAANEVEAGVTELALLEAEPADAGPPEAALAENDDADAAPGGPATGGVAARQAQGTTPTEAPVQTEPVATNEGLAPEAAGAPASSSIAATASPADAAPEQTTGPEPAPGISGGAAPDPAPQEAAEPQAPTVMIADAQGIRVVQSGGPEPRVQVLLDTISYDAQGEVLLAGRGPAQSDVRLYLDNQPVQLARIDTAGGWSTQLPRIDPGTYTLRVDEVSAEGAVLSRIETPFLREEPAVLETLPQRDGVSVITVQPGHTLWGIAREELGAGALYVQVYEANRNLIRDPHWIYPGQIFAIPDEIAGQ